jgi:hypothetical protein
MLTPEPQNNDYFKSLIGGELFMVAVLDLQKLQAASGPQEEPQSSHFSFGC